MTKDEVILSLVNIGNKQIKLRREIGILEKQLKAVRKELKETEKEMFYIRSTKEYEEIYPK